MGTARNGSRVAIAAMAAVALSACGAIFPTADESQPTAAPLTSAPVEGSAAASAIPAPHPFAGEGDWIAYQTNRDGVDGIWFIHPDGTEDHEVALRCPASTVTPTGIPMAPSCS